MKLNEFVDPVKYNTVLNPKLWENERLKSDVRGALLRIAQDFVDFIEVPVKVLDIVMYGGNVNYNYTPSSDIDLHLVVDMGAISCEREAAEMFDSKRRLYKLKHDIRIRGIEVELYVEDVNETPVSSSYSVMRGNWIKKPDPNMPQYDHAEVEHMTKVWQLVLQEAMKTGDLQTCRNSLQLLRRYRRLGLATPEAEFSVPNLVFKSLRNDQTLNGMMAMIDRLHDQELSIR
jgi:predicted nucleotidyltransferase